MRPVAYALLRTLQRQTLADICLLKLTQEHHCNTHTRSITMNVNIALDKHASQSSYSPWSSPGEASRAAAGRFTGGFSFHTDCEDRPWWQVDLDSAYTLKSIVVYNRDAQGSDFAERARSLAAYISNDGMLWQEVHAGGQSFGGSLDGQPLKIDCSDQAARFVRLQLKERNYLHLDGVEVLGEVPAPSLLQLGSKYGTDKVGHGFCSVYQQAFGDVRARVTKILEFGVFFGASLRMWRDWFPNAIVHGADHFTGHQGNGRHFEDADRFLKEVSQGHHDRIVLHQIDQARSDELDAFCAAQLQGSFDLIIDDGSHLMLDQQLTLGTLFGLLAPGGYFVMEDLHSSLCDDYDVKPDRSNSTLLMIERALAGQGWQSEYLSAAQQAFLDAEVDLSQTTIHRSGTSLTCIIRRRQAAVAATLVPAIANSALVLDYATHDSLNQTRQQAHIRWVRQWLAQDRESDTNGPANTDIVCFGPEVLDAEFVARNRSILSRQRGGGYWLWKPYVIATMLARTNAEFLIYCDSGSTFLQPPSALIDALRISGAAVLAFDTSANGWAEKHWTKGQVLRAMEATDPSIVDSAQVAATASVWRVCEQSRQLAQTWLALMQVPEFATDSPSADGGGDDPGFREHRHDQSVFSVLVKKVMLSSEAGSPIVVLRDFRSWIGHHHIS